MGRLPLTCRLYVHRILGKDAAEHSKVHVYKKQLTGLARYQVNITFLVLEYLALGPAISSSADALCPAFSAFLRAGSLWQPQSR